MPTGGLILRDDGGNCFQGLPTLPRVSVVTEDVLPYSLRHVAFPACVTCEPWRCMVARWGSDVNEGLMIGGL